MHLLIKLLSSAVSIYIILIFIRIIISWFSRDFYSKPVDLLCKITDPYIDWWRKKINLRLGFMDLSPIIGIAVLSVLLNILYTIQYTNSITIGAVLSIILMSIWSIVSFVLGFCVIILVLRLFAYLTNRDIYTPFWKIIESITQPLLYKANRLLYGKRIGSYLKAMIISILILTAIWIGGGYIMPRLATLFLRLPL